MNISKSSSMTPILFGTERKHMFLGYTMLKDHNLFMDFQGYINKIMKKNQLQERRF